MPETKEKEFKLKPDELVELEQFIKSIQRIPWNIAKQLFRANNLDTSLGWERTQKKLLSDCKDDKKKYDASINLKNDYINYLKVGNKSVRFFLVDPKYVKPITNLLSKFTIIQNKFSKNYPFILTEKELKNIGKTPTIVDLSEIDDGEVITLCSKRSYYERKIISPESLGTDAFNDYDEIIAVKQRSIQSFDVIVIRDIRIDKKALIEVRVDAPQELSADVIEYGFTQLTTYFNSLVSAAIGKKDLLDKPVDLFKVIESIYDDSKEGRVCELGFTTDDASVKNDKIRQSHDMDLRTGIFHKAGVKAVGHITPFKLATQWKRINTNKIKSEPELFLPGNYRMLQNPKLKLRDAKILKCITLSDYEFVLDRLLKRL